MKQVTATNQKWILSFALIAVLTSQSNFKITSPSEELKSTEMASRSIAEATPPPKGKYQIGDKIYDADKPESKSATELDKKLSLEEKVNQLQGKIDLLVKKLESSPEKEPAKAETQSEVIARMEKQIKELTAKLEEKKKTEAKAGALDCTDGECSSALIKKTAKLKIEKDPEDETPAERRARLKEEKEERAEAKKAEKEEKEAAKQAKKEEKEEKAREKAEAIAEKLKEKKDKVNESFETKMTEIAEKCSENDIVCIGRSMTETLKDYSGKDKVRPDNLTVTKAFNKYFSDALRSAVNDPNAQESVMATINRITADTPSEYRFLKEKSLDIVTLATTNKAVLINSEFAKAAQFGKANRPAEASQALTQAIQEKAQLQENAQLITNAAISGNSQSMDTATDSYIQRTYLPSLSKIILSINGSGSALDSINANGRTGRGSNTSSILNTGNINSNLSLQTGNLNTVDFGMLNGTRTGTRFGH